MKECFEIDRLIRRLYCNVTQARHMKITAKLLAFSLLVTCLCVVRVEDATYYVSANGTNPISPYADWSTAATNIQDAANLAVSNDIILVTNGVYDYGGASVNGSNRVYLAGAYCCKASMVRLTRPFRDIGFRGQRMGIMLCAASMCLLTPRYRGLH